MRQGGFPTFNRHLYMDELPGLGWQDLQQLMADLAKGKDALDASMAIIVRILVCKAWAAGQACLAHKGPHQWMSLVPPSPLRDYPPAAAGRAIPGPAAAPGRGGGTAWENRPFRSRTP